MCLLSQRSGLGKRCIEHLLERSGRPCVLSSGLNPADDSKDDHVQVQNHHGCTRVAGMFLVGDSVVFSQKSLVSGPV